MLLPFVTSVRASASSAGSSCVSCMNASFTVASTSRQRPRGHVRHYILALISEITLLATHRFDLQCRHDDTSAAMRADSYFTRLT